MLIWSKKAEHDKEIKLIITSENSEKKNYK